MCIPLVVLWINEICGMILLSGKVSSLIGSGWYEVILMPLKSEEERRGRGRPCVAEMDSFFTFIDLMNLVDLPVVGNRFTWFIFNGSYKSRLDRLLIYEELINK